jgi:hypothetical protein
VPEFLWRRRSGVGNHYGGTIEIREPGEHADGAALDLSLISTQGHSTAVAFTREDLDDLMAVLAPGGAWEGKQIPEFECAHGHVWRSTGPVTRCPCCGTVTFTVRMVVDCTYTLAQVIEMGWFAPGQVQAARAFLHAWDEASVSDGEGMLMHVDPAEMRRMWEAVDEAADEFARLDPKGAEHRNG